MHKRLLRIAFMGFLLTGCSAQILEDVGEVAAPRPCTETVKLFNTFSMRAKNVAWKGDQGTTPATLTLDLVFYNDKNFPIALSNSGNGVLYAVTFSLQGKDGPVAPKEASGVVLAREGKTVKKPRNPGPFGEPQKRKSSRAAADKAKAPADPTTKDTNFRIKPGEPQEGRLIFQLPRDNGLLTIERKFANEPPAAQPGNLITACTISAKDVAGQQPGMPGVY